MAAEAVWDIATQSCLRYRTRTHNDVYTYSTLTMWIIGSLVENLPERDNLSTRDKSSAPKVSLLRRFDCMRTVNDQRENL